MKEMVGGCCVCSDERGWAENPLVYCDGQGCNVAVHQACYGIVQVPTGPWFCRKCESQERSARVRCELCPSKDGALKRTDSGGWAHVVCALYIPEVRFGNVTTMEPIILQLVPQDRYNKLCYICEDQGKESKACVGACMQCNKSGCKQYFHVTCAQAAGLLCEEAGNYEDNVKYCGYCIYHYQKLRKDSHIKIIPAFKPIPADNATPEPSPEKLSPGYLKEKGRAKSERRAKQAAYASNSVVSNSDLSNSVNIDQDLSDSSASTISNTSLNNGTVLVAPECSKSESKFKKGDIIHSNSNSCNSKMNNINLKDSTSTPSQSPAYGSPKPGKKKSKDSSISGLSKKSPPNHKDCIVEVTDISSTPSFTSMYETFIAKEAENNQSTSEKKRSADCSDEPEKKKSKHSRSKSKKEQSLKSLIEANIPPEKTNPHIPIVRIKRKFNHDTSTSVHSVEEVSIDEPKSYEAIIAKTEPEPEPEVRERTPSPKPTCSKQLPDDQIEGEGLPFIDAPINNIDIKMEHPYQENLDVPSETFTMPMPDTLNLMDRMTKQMQNSDFSEESLKPPSTLEELLEKQWVQTSNFLLGQAQHFDIASMISCLYEIKNENMKMEKQISDLVNRRDSLLAINARLKVLPGTENAASCSNLPYSALNVMHAKPVSPSNVHHATAGYSGYMSYDNGMVHSTQDYGCHKSPIPGHSPVATVGSSSLPLTPSPIPCSPIPKSDVYPHLSAYNHDSSPLSHVPIVTSATSQPGHLYGPSATISNPLLMPDASSYNSLACHNGTADDISLSLMQQNDDEPSTAVYQTISPPFSNPEITNSPHASDHPVCNNIVFHQNFENALQNANNSMEEDR
ncbi:protein AF-10 isoform X1 [Parasteatoda tepidariorum]|uniref:protein AF-10 isoform X1 n=2 Tax=Parasteatoda tepidariorum TaxID=114398 RepID=UPI001C71D378|nr:protein AF-10 isoform X2 [Parasteatoda tepidariorum]